MAEHPREQELIQGAVGESGWLFRTAPMTGFIELYGPVGELTILEALDEPISAIDALSGEEGTGLLVIGTESKQLVRRVENGRWVVPAE